jgi:hypothetical protein
MTPSLAEATAAALRRPGASTLHEAAGGEAVAGGGLLVGPGERGEARAAKQQEVMERRRPGALTLDLLGLRGGPEG